MFPYSGTSTRVIGLLLTADILLLVAGMCSSFYYGGKGMDKIAEISRFSKIFAELQNEFAEFELPRLVPKQVGILHFSLR